MEIIVTILFIFFIIALSSSRPRKYQSKKAKKPSENDSDVPTLTIQVSTDNPFRQKSSASPDSVWIPKGRPATVAGYVIPEGLLYVGRGLSSVVSHK